MSYTPERAWVIKFDGDDPQYIVGRRGNFRNLQDARRYPSAEDAIAIVNFKHSASRYAVDIVPVVRDTCDADWREEQP